MCARSFAPPVPWQEEMSQPAHAHADGLSRNRLNRVYANEHAVETLHKDTRFWANNFDVALNHRRLVSMVRRDKLANNKR